jgi:hypothetical protein
MKRKVLTKAELIALRRTAFVELAEGGIYVRGLNGRERSLFEQKALSGEMSELADIRQRVVCWCALDENGRRLFEDGDLESISEMDGADLETITQAIVNLSGLGTGAIESAEKN